MQMNKCQVCEALPLDVDFCPKCNIVVCEDCLTECGGCRGCSSDPAGEDEEPQQEDVKKELITETRSISAATKQRQEAINKIEEIQSKIE